MSNLYGVARISTGKQNIERQIRNILAKYPEAKIIKETYTATKLEGRKEFEKLLRNIQSGDKIVFDSVSRMSRNSQEGCDLYEKLFNQNVAIEFLKEPHINTETYKQALENQIETKLYTGNKATDEFVNSVMLAVNKYIIALAKEQIKIAFDQAEKEVKDLHKRTSEGILTAKLNGKQIGQKKGAKLTTKKSIKSKEIILKYSKEFDGTLKDIECMKLTELNRNTYYKYKRELKEELKKL